MYWIIEMQMNKMYISCVNCPILSVFFFSSYVKKKLNRCLLATLKSREIRFKTPTHDSNYSNHHQIFQHVNPIKCFKRAHAYIYTQSHITHIHDHSMIFAHFFLHFLLLSSKLKSSRLIRMMSCPYPLHYSPTTVKHTVVRISHTFIRRYIDNKNASTINSITVFIWHLYQKVA